MMNSKILLAGIGGQGVLFAHQILAECAAAQGYNVTGAETHGMSQRGGAVVSHLKIGDSPAPLIRQGTADFLLAFDSAEAYRSLAFIRRGGTVVVNCGIADFPDVRVREQLAAMNVTTRLLNADALAQSLGRASAVNVVLIGFASQCDAFPLATDALRETIQRIARPQVVALNLKAFDGGVKKAMSQPWHLRSRQGKCEPFTP